MPAMRFLQAGAVSQTSLVVSSAFGKKLGIATINEFDDTSLEKVVRRAEELAQLAPENPEYVPFLGPQKFQDSITYVSATAAHNAYSYGQMRLRKVYKWQKTQSLLLRDISKIRMDLPQ